jgi:hypothetical protein
MGMIIGVYVESIMGMARVVYIIIWPWPEGSIQPTLWAWTDGSF